MTSSLEDVLTALAQAAAEATTLMGLVRHVAPAVGAHLPLLQVQLHTPHHTLLAWREHDAWWVREGSGTPPPAATREVVLELGEQGRSRWWLRRPPRWAHTATTRRALEASLALGVRACRLLERVAAVSRRAHLENRRLRSELQRDPELVARAPAMREALARAEAVSPHPSAVLVRGASGTGKGVLARWIHARSPRSDAPFVHVNCGALPEGLVESELFGHAQGAFTGAARRHRGAFARADGGTLFLDEVGDLPLAAQVKVLRVLQEGCFEPVGEETTQRVDVRVIAATHQALTPPAFREDLYYRLSVFPITVPTLRERREDLPRLIHDVLADLAGRLRLPATPTLDPEATAALESYRWPGNVRELRNVLERAAILAGGGVIRRAHVELEPREAPTHGPTWEEGTRGLLEEALRVCRGKIHGADGAAARLGLKPTTLQTKLRKLGVRRADFDPRHSGAPHG